MSNELSRFNRVRYTLYGKPFGSIVIKEPRGWQDDEKELLRSEKFHGIMTSLSNNLQFYGDAKTAIKSAYDIFGIKADVRLEKEERNSNTDAWELSYEGNLDFSTYQEDKNFIIIKFNESQFFKNIESRFKDKFELERLDDLKGGVLPPLTYSNLEFKGRDIFRESKLKNTRNLFFKPGDDGFQNEYWSLVPSELLYKSDDNFFVPSFDILTTGYVNAFGRKLSYVGIDPLGSVTLSPNSGQVFYLNSPTSKTLRIRVEIKVNVTHNAGFNFGMFFVLSRHQVDENNNLTINYLDLQILSQFTVVNGTTTSHEFIWEGDVSIPERGCLCLSSRNPGITQQTLITYEKAIVIQQENDLSNTTNCQVITYYQAFERLFQIITGRNTFQSDLLTNKWKDLLLTNGFKIRQFPDKPITISLEELFNSISVFDDVALIIQNQIVRVELKDSVYIPEIAIDLGTVSNIKRKILPKLHFSRIEIGYDFNGEYEEVVGLDEYNIKNEYSTCVDTVEEPFTQISKVRADGYGMTFAQEKQYADNPKEDTKYDKFNFAIDAIEVSQGNYEMRYWQEDFDDEPTGIFSPQTAFNLRLSPFNCLLRKGKFISTGLQKFPSELLKYSSTEGNSQLVTLYPERAVISNSVLAKPYFLPEEISFDKKISMLQFKQIINSKYKMIKFVNEFGKQEYGFIYPSVKPNKEGKFVLIKANL